MAEHPRIEELRRRVQRDKGSIAFAQLAEEYRRAGRLEEAIETCRAGLGHHPGYLSAHVTLGRALIEVGQLQPAQEELQRVLAAAPENLAALKGLAEIHHRRGELREAHDLYRRVLDFAPHDPDLEHLVSQLARELEPAGTTAEVPGGLSFEEAMGEFLALDAQGPSQPPPPAAQADPSPAMPSDFLAAVPVQAEEWPAPELGPAPVVPLPADGPAPVQPDAPTAARADAGSRDDDAAPLGAPAPAPPIPEARAAMQVEALERWLDAILADRQQNR